MICHNKDPLKDGRWSRTKHLTLQKNYPPTHICMSDRIVKLLRVPFYIEQLAFASDIGWFQKLFHDHEIESFFLVYNEQLMNW